VVVGNYYDSNNNSIGFIYNGSTFTDLIDPNGVNGTDAYGINDSGVVVGYYANSNNNGIGFIATPASTNVPFEFSPEQGFMLGIPLFLGLRKLKKIKSK